MQPSLAARRIEKAILDVLAGGSLYAAAARAALPPAELAAAVDLYQAAGYAALEAQTVTRLGWVHVHIEFTDWDRAESVAADHLGPQLRQFEEADLLASWWFVRKAPYWRLRCLHTATLTQAELAERLAAALNAMRARGLLAGIGRSIYEPEALAFGGPDGISAAHDLFHADSQAILGYLRRHTAPPEHGIGRRELSVMLCSALFRGAGQDWYEQGDVWRRVAEMRPLPPGTPTDRIPEMAPALKHLMTLASASSGPLFGHNRPLAYASPWTAAFTRAGRRLGHAAHQGTLQRGIREVLAHHVIFHWNRLGLTARSQGILSRAARDTVMARPSHPPDALPANH